MEEGYEQLDLTPGTIPTRTVLLMASAKFIR